ncbi:PRD domain-containing protein [Enterococcus entomosocium]|uniref:BglG family transcription antiterminator LicT n=1 Tax=Enterococcus entomosocium TaxID=3034352 RepID=UPI003D6AD4D6
MRIARVLNNNAVVSNVSGTEQILLGKGIAFKKKVGDEISLDDVNKVFILTDVGTNEKFKQILEDIPFEYIALAYETYDSAKKELGVELSESLVISLSDHIFSSTKRIREGTVLKNGLLWEIKRFYEKEFNVAKKTLNRVHQKFGIEMPEDEIGFIASHIINAEMSAQDSTNLSQIMKVMQEVTSIVKYHFHTEFDMDSVYYYRFVSHLKYFAERMIKGNAYKDDRSDDLFYLITEKYSLSYNCVQKIEEYLSTNYSYDLTSEEAMYLTIHIDRLIYK